jgi:hypothetical protein
MIKTFRACPKQAQYKYVERLKPKSTSKPLRQGTWMHALLETHYKGGDWRKTHRQFCKQFGKLFDEEREFLGNLPLECEALMVSYLWHYKDDPWTVLDVEFTLETEFPDGTIYRAKIDLLIENQYGLWIVDHKWNKSLPNLDFRILDAQSALYIWAAIQNGLDVQGHIWNYGKRKMPSVPQLLKDGTRLSRSKIDTDYPTFMRALKKYGLDPTPYADQIAVLKKQRYKPGKLQTSPFFRRDVLEKTDEMVKQVAREGYHTASLLNNYDFDRTEFVERHPDRSCTYMCSYVDLCTLELFGGEPRLLRRNRYEVTDPMYYYYDDPKGEDKDG